MSAREPDARHFRWGLAARWCAGLMLAFGIHAAGAVALMTQWNEEPDSVASAPAILIDFAPAPVAPATVPEQPVGPPQPQAIEQPEPAPEKPVAEEAETEPAPEPPVEEKVVEPAPKPEPPVEETITLPPEPQPQFAMVTLPPPRPAIKPPAKERLPKRKASLASAPAAAERKAPRAAAPAPGAATHAPNPRAVASWKTRLVAQLERYKRFPAEAQARGEQGVSQIAFSIDRAGGVHNPRIVRSSGSNLLDRATMNLVQRAQPLPPPPADVPGSRIAIVVPIRYHIR